MGAQHGAVNAADLILARGAGEFVDWANPDEAIAWKSKRVCQAHMQELLTKWGKRRTQRAKIHRGWEICSLPEALGSHSTRIEKKFGTLTRDEAKAVLHKTGVLAHVGIPLCKTHKLWAERLRREQIDKASPKKYPAHNKNYKQAITVFMRALNLGPVNLEKSFTKLTGAWKLRRSKQWLALANIMAKAMSPDDPDALKRMALKEELKRLFEKKQNDIQSKKSYTIKNTQPKIQQQQRKFAKQHSAQRIDDKDKKQIVHGPLKLNPARNNYIDTPEPTTLALRGANLIDWPKSHDLRSKRKGEEKIQAVAKKPRAAVDDVVRNEPPNLQQIRGRIAQRILAGKLGEESKKGRDSTPTRCLRTRTVRMTLLRK